MQARIAFLESNLSGTGFEAIEVAKRMGHHVTFVTSDLEYYRRAGGGLDESLLDQVITCDTADAAAVASMVWRCGGAQALLTVSEWHVIVAAEAAARLGLPGSGPDAVRAARDKSRTRQLCAGAGVPIPGYERVGRAHLPPGGVRLPCVVKPVDGVLSSGVRLCRTAAEAEQQLRTLFDGFDQPNERGQRRIPAALIEEYLDGPEFSVETLTYEGQTEIVAITRKLLSAPPAFVETGHVVPAHLHATTWRQCADLVRAALAAIGYTFGAAHVELRVTASGPKLIEINCRLAGDRITRLVTLATGVDMIAHLIDMHLGHRLDVRAGPRRGAAIVFLPSRDGLVSEIDGVAEAKAMPGVLDAAVYLNIGAEHIRVGNNSDRAGHVLAVGPTPASALRRAEQAAQRLRVTVSESPTSVLT